VRPPTFASGLLVIPVTPISKNDRPLARIRPGEGSLARSRHHRRTIRRVIGRASRDPRKPWLIQTSRPPLANYPKLATFQGELLCVGPADGAFPVVVEARLTMQRASPMPIKCRRGCQAQYRLERVERACPNVAKDNAQGRKAERGQATRDCRPSCGADGVGHAGWSSHSALERTRHAPRSTGRQRPRSSEAMFRRIARASAGFDPTRRLNGAISNGAFGAKPEARDLGIELPLSADSGHSRDDNRALGLTHRTALAIVGASRKRTQGVERPETLLMATVNQFRSGAQRRDHPGRIRGAMRS
jgi:hypothetical protein